MRSYLVTMENGRMLLIEQAFGPGLAKAAAYRLAQQNGWHPNVKHVSEVSEKTAAILMRGNQGMYTFPALSNIGCNDACCIVESD